MHIRSLLLSLLLAVSPTALALRKPANSVLLSSVQTLTLHDGKKTTHRRVSAVPQLNCVGGNAKGLYNVDVMRCKNAGSEYNEGDVQWTCQASLPPEFKLGSTDVICEGYDSSDDPYILKGSCGVDYRLVLTEMGEEKYGKRGPKGVFDTSDSSKSGGDTLAGYLFWAVFIGITGFILYAVLFPDRSQGGRRQRPARGFGGGGGDDGSDDPPPPYSPRPPQPRSSYSKAKPSGQNESWRPGFFTGAATGAAAGYAMGARGNRSRQQDPQPGPSNWFGGGRRETPSYNAPSAGPSTPPSSSRYESTGFGGTTRR